MLTKKTDDIQSGREVLRNIGVFFLVIIAAIIAVKFLAG